MSATTKKPAIVLVPGSFGHSSYYESTVQPLREAGIAVHILDPPSYYSKKSGPLPTMNDDAAFISSFVSKLLDAGEKVVLVAHSYGGTPSSQSLKGLSMRERKQKGEAGGVVRLGFLTAVVPRLGKTPAEFMARGEKIPMEADEDGWLRHTEPEVTARVCFNHSTDEQGLKEVAKFGLHSSAAFGDPLTHAGYKDVPVSWFFCEDDLCITPEMQQDAVDAIEESWRESGRSPDDSATVDVTRVKTDHIAVNSAKGELFKWFNGLVEKGGKE